MAKKSEIQAQIDALQAQLEGADTDDEVWVKEGDREFKVTGHRATSILDRFSDLWKPTDADAGDGKGDGKGDAGTKDDNKPDGGGYFGRRK